MSLQLFRVMMASCLALVAAGLVSALTFDEGSITVEQASRDVATADSTTSTVSGGATDDDSSETTEGGDTSTTTGDTTGDSTETTVPQDTTTTTQSQTTTTRPVLGTNPTTPGSYTYDVSGTVDGDSVSGTSTLTVPEAGSDGRQAQVQQGPDGKTTTVYRFTAEGTYLEELRMESEMGSFSLQATSPFLIIPAEADPGTTTQGRLQGNGLTADVTFTLADANESQSTANLVADISGTVSGFEVDGTMETTIVARSSDQLPLRTESRSDISAAGGLFSSSSNTTSSLRQ